MSSIVFIWNEIQNSELNISQLKNQEIKKDKEDACMQLSKQNLFKTLWECTKCGKLFVDGKSGELITYEADSKKYNQILNKK